MTRSFVVATAGHVDHGKSALVRALTGTDPDRLPEEKARGITIDLGFAHLVLPTPTVTFEIGIVDVPGHEDFVKNMAAGAIPADAALLVVAADDGPMTQTAEHLEILIYAGVTRGVVALTKADRLPDAAALAVAIAAVRRRLTGTPLADAPIVPTSAHDGRGLDALKAAIVDVLAAAPPREDGGRPRLAVDRVFSPRGVGTVVTGTLVGGPLSRGQQVVVRPGGTPAKVRTLQTFGRAVETAPPGSRVAANLPDVAAGVAAGRSVARGDTLTGVDPGVTPVDATVLDVDLWRLPNAAGPPPRDGTLVRVHHGTAAVAAKLRLRESTTIPPGGRASARLTLARPLPALLGDRLVVRSDSGQHTLAGGVVLDVNPPRRPAAAQAALLAGRAAGADGIDARRDAGSPRRRAGPGRAPGPWRSSRRARRGDRGPGPAGPRCRRRAGRRRGGGLGRTGHRRFVSDRRPSRGPPRRTWSAGRRAATAGADPHEAGRRGRPD